MTSKKTSKKTYPFQAEVTELLQLMVHSLYSNQEIFLRELISNASDACDKLRFQALSDKSLYGDDLELKIWIEIDKKQKTLTIGDNGIGMNADQIMDNLGTIAKSGTRHFLQNLTGDQTKDSQMIGQFGVGFYSALMVAERVVVNSCAAGQAPKQAIAWESDGKGEYSLTPINKKRGTEVVLHLNKQAAKTFLDDNRIRQLITTYSEHIAFPIEMKNDKDQWESVNKASALWTLQKKQISDEQYQEFYKHIAHDFENPQTWIHNHVEGKQAYISLFYIPARAPFDLFDRDKRHGIKLYVKRVFIMDDAKNLMPPWLRFVRGLVDSSDLPLNVSRELLQNNQLIGKIKSASVKKILGLLEKMAEKDPEQYSQFWQNFGQVLKEGPVEDHANRERLLKLLRFHSTEAQSVSLAQYIERMPEKQDKIYYVLGENLNAAKSNPALGVFREKGIEVLLLFERVDEWMMSHIRDFSDKSFQSITSSDLDLTTLTDADDKDNKPDKTNPQDQALIERMQKVLGSEVKAVKISSRLTDAPSCIVQETNDMSMHLQKIMRNAGHALPNAQPILEINMDHPLVIALHQESDEDRFADWSRLLLEQAILSEGGELADPPAFVARLNQMLATLSGADKSSRIIV